MGGGVVKMTGNENPYPPLSLVLAEAERNLQRILQATAAAAAAGAAVGRDVENNLKDAALAVKTLRFLRDEGWQTINREINDVSDYMIYRNEDGAVAITNDMIEKGIVGDILTLKPVWNCLRRYLYKNDVTVAYLFRVYIFNKPVYVYIKPRFLPLPNIPPAMRQIKLKDGVAWVDEETLNKIITVGAGDVSK